MKRYNIDTIEIGLSSYCNLKCPLCTRNKIVFKHKVTYPKFTPTELDYDKLINFLNIIKPKEIKLVGAVCEPSLYSRFHDLLSFCFINEIKVWLSTNGSTKNEEFWEKVGKIMPANSIVNFDIDHTDKEKQQFYRRGSDLTKIIKNIKAFIKGTKIVPRNITTQAQRISFKWNEDNRQEHTKLCKSLGIGVYDIPCYDFNEGEFNEDLSFFEHGNEDNYKLFRKTSKFKNQEIICQSRERNEIYLNFQGEVMPCCYINDEILQSKHRYINIYSNDIMEIMDNYYNIINEAESGNKASLNPFNKVCEKFCNKMARKLCRDNGLDP